ncbi:MAG: hypothetical protein ACO1QR_01045 [Chthoniobacteraceae bacterium]
MSFDEFQNYARLYIVGGLDDQEVVAFQRARKFYGDVAEEFIRECRQLNSAFALSLRPEPPREDARDRLMALIEQSSGGNGMRTRRQ